jgi:hypothetical protein
VSAWLGMVLMPVLAKGACGSSTVGRQQVRFAHWYMLYLLQLPSRALSPRESRSRARGLQSPVTEAWCAGSSPAATHSAISAWQALWL